MDSSVAHTQLRHLAAVCYRELFTDDVIRTEGIRVELSQLAASISTLRLMDWLRFEGWDQTEQNKNMK